MFSYLAYQIRTNPNSLTTNYIEDMKGYFSFIGLSMNDEEKTIKANHYFSKTKDPFFIQYPEEILRCGRSNTNGSCSYVTK